MKKHNNQKSADASRLKDEMAEGKNPEVAAAIYREGDKYYCAECRSELPIHQNCPTCHAHIDWDRFISESVPRS